MHNKSIFTIVVSEDFWPPQFLFQFRLNPNQKEKREKKNTCFQSQRTISVPKSKADLASFLTKSLAEKLHLNFNTENIISTERIRLQSLINKSICPLFIHLYV